MIRRTKVVALIFFLCALGTGAVFAHDEPGEPPRLATRDKIRIVAFQPSGAVRRGVETEFTIEIEVDLQSAKEGVARVGFNLDSPTSFRMIDSRDLHEGIQKIKFSVKTKPVDWAIGVTLLRSSHGPKDNRAAMDAHGFGTQNHSCEAISERLPFILLQPAPGHAAVI